MLETTMTAEYSEAHSRPSERKEALTMDELRRALDSANKRNRQLSHVNGINMEEKADLREKVRQLEAQASGKDNAAALKKLKGQVEKETKRANAAEERAAGLEFLRKTLEMRIALFERDQRDLAEYKKREAAEYAAYLQEHPDDDDGLDFGEPLEAGHTAAMERERL